MKILKEISFQRLYLFSVVILLLWTLIQFPYVNLYISPVIVGIFLYIVFIFIFKIRPVHTILFSCFVILLSIPWTIVGSRNHVEGLGEFAFILFVIAFGQLAWDLRKKV